MPPPTIYARPRNYDQAILLAVHIRKLGCYYSMGTQSLSISCDIEEQYNNAVALLNESGVSYSSDEYTHGNTPPVNDVKIDVDL